MSDFYLYLKANYDAWFIVLEITMLVIQAWCIVKFLGAFLEKKQWNLRLITALLLFLIFQFLGSIGILSNMNFIIGLGFVVGLILLIAVTGFEKAGLKKLFLSIMVYALWLLVSITVTFITQNMPIFMFWKVIATLVMIIGVNFAPLLGKNKWLIPLRYFDLLLVVPLGSLFIAINADRIGFNVYFSGLETPQSKLTLEILLFLLLLFNIIIFHLYAKLGEYMVIEREKIIFTQQINSISRSTEEQKKIMQDFHEAKHNLVNELIGLKDSFENDDRKTIIDNFSKTINRISTGAEISNSGNKTVDALINFKYAMSKELDIKFKLKLFIPDFLPIDQSDLGCVIGNALDNAIEATVKCELDKRIIDIGMSVRKEALVIVMKNPCQTIKASKDKMQSGQGYGLKSIDKIANKYHGSVLTTFDNGTFKITVIMNLPADEE